MEVLGINCTEASGSKCNGAVCINCTHCVTVGTAFTPPPSPARVRQGTKYAVRNKSMSINQLSL